MKVAAAATMIGWPAVLVMAGGAVVAGLLVGLLGPVGDLAESAIKRNLGVKDSGSLIPGHPRYETWSAGRTEAPQASNPGRFCPTQAAGLRIPALALILLAARAPDQSSLRASEVVFL